MNERRKIENRKSFTEEVKDYIRYKSDGRCSHCGKVLKDDFTVEHVIPLNKGGSDAIPCHTTEDVITQLC